MTSSKERTPLERLQPASLVPHYKFSAKAAHVTDAAGDHVPLVRFPSSLSAPPNATDQGEVFRESRRIQFKCTWQLESWACLELVISFALEAAARLHIDHHFQAFWLQILKMDDPIQRQRNYTKITNKTGNQIVIPSLDTKVLADGTSLVAGGFKGR